MIIKTQKERRTPNPFGQGNINPTNEQTMKWLKNVHPNFSKHIWQRNGLVQAIAMERFGGVDVLELPVCERCERPGAWHDNDSCWCNGCGHTTKKENTKTLYRYIAEDSMPGGMDKEALELLNNMLVPTLSGALREMFENIDTLEDRQYEQEEDEGTMQVEETIIDDTFEEENDNETVETSTDDSTVP